MDGPTAGRRRTTSTAGVPDVYSADELAHVLGRPRSFIQQLIAAGEIATVDGLLVSHRDAIRAIRRRHASRRRPVRQIFGSALLDRSIDGRSTRLSVAMTTMLHGVVVLVAALVTTSQLTTAADSPVARDGPALTRLVFVAEPGPGGGGGGGGLRSPLPAPAAARRGTSRISSPVPPREEPVVVEPVEEIEPEPEPEPLEHEELPRIFAPLVEARADMQDVRGLLNAAAPAETETPSPGSGRDGGVGRGDGRGIGEGRGAGVGPGTGGGTGGGPYRPGSGISPPAIAYEVKPEYTEEARRRRVEGDIVLEVIVLADGSVGRVRVIRGLGYGLDVSAVRAMRSWRFHPAQRHGTAVDVVVEVAMEFRLR